MFTVLLPPGDNPIAVNKYITYCLFLLKDKQKSRNNWYDVLYALFTIEKG
jgi:hypothetical protein